MLVKCRELIEVKKKNPNRKLFGMRVEQITLDMAQLLIEAHEMLKPPEVHDGRMYYHFTCPMCGYHLHTPGCKLGNWLEKMEKKP